MSRWGGFDPSDALGVATVLGVGFSLVAWAITIGMKPLPYSVSEPARELITLAIYFIALTAFVTWGFDWLRRMFPAGPSHKPSRYWRQSSWSLSLFRSGSFAVALAIAGDSWRQAHSSPATPSS